MKVLLLICGNENLVVPTILQNYVVNLYHKYLLHPVMDRTESTIIQQLYWPNLREDFCTHIKV